MPILNAASVRSIPPNTLVRFRGMIQDMLGNEFYVGAYKVFDLLWISPSYLCLYFERLIFFSSYHVKDGGLWRTNKFMDVSQFPMDLSSDKRVWERRLLYCVPVSFSYASNFWAYGCRTQTLASCYF